MNNGRSNRLPTRGLAATTALAAATFALALGAVPVGAQVLRDGGDAFARSRTSNTLLYASNFYPATIEIYAADKPGVPLIGEIGNGLSNLYNLCVDRTGALYAQNNNGTISVYNPRALTPNKTLYESVRQGTGVGITVADDGSVYTSDPYDSLVFVFAPGSTRNTGTISLASPLGVAVDKRGTLFVSYSASASRGGVMAFPGGKQPGYVVNGISLQLTGGLAFDRAGNLLVGDQGTKMIGVYKVRAHSASLQRQIASNYPYEFTVDSHDKNLYLVSGDQPNGVSVYDYASGALLNSITAGFSSQDYAEGVALAPG